MNLRKLFAAQLAVCVICSNAAYAFGRLDFWVPAIQAVLLCSATYVTVQFVGKNFSIATGAAVWVGLLSASSLLVSFSMRPKDGGFDAGIYDRGPLFLGLICAAFCLLFWKLLPWEPLERQDESREFR